MKIVVLFLMFAAIAAAQTLAIGCPQGAAAGSIMTCPIVLAGGGNAGAGLEFTIGAAAGDVLSNPLIAGSASAAGKTLTCGFPTTNICVIAGGLGTIADGTVATVSVALPLAHAGQSDQFILSNTLGATPAAAIMAIAPGPMGTTAVIRPRCDLNGDGTFTSADVSLILGAAVSATPNLAQFDLDLNGKVDIVDVMIEVIAVLNGTCLAH